MGKQLQLRTLGGVQIQIDDQPVTGFDSRKVPALLVYLACTRREHPREVLAEMLWEERTQAQALANLRVALHSLNQTVGEYVETPRETVGLNPAAEVWMDAAEFEERLTTAGAGDAAALDTALALYRGDFLSGFFVDSSAFEQWATRERERLRLRAMEGLDRLIAVRLAQKEYSKGIAAATRLLDMDPLREETYRHLMELLWRSGQRGKALEQYETCRRALYDELGVAPSPETSALYERIRAGETPERLAVEPSIRSYELRERIGEGGFGTVYRAWQPVVNREVAIKVIRPEYANHPDFIRRFEAEAQVVARLEHMNIVPLYDYWREPGGAYLVMRYLRGGSLRERLAQGPLSLSETVRLVEQMAAALTIAHRNYVIHRDLKPANILLDEDGNAYLTDFGIAKALVPGGQATQDGALVGSPAYLSPEQIRSEPVTPQSDLYSFGLMIYEVLTGQLPFPGDLSPSALLYKQLSEPLPSPGDTRPDLPPLLDSVIQQATAKDPAQRYPDALSLAKAFREAAGPVMAIPASRASVAVRTPLEVTHTWTPADELVALRNPYKGLRAFSEADSADFFGREGLVDQLVARLAEDDPLARFLAVVGPSGSGKSSVVRAGLIPALRRGTLPGSEGWFITDLLPGLHPLEEIELALIRLAASPDLDLLPLLRQDRRGLLRAARRVLPEDTHLLLVIDQFEEVFTLADDPTEIRHLLDSLYTTVTDPRSPIRVVITLRADFFDRPLLHPEFGTLVSQRTHVVLPLTSEELERAICVPAERVGVRMEPGLAAAIVADVTEQPGALPMLQYALTELFDTRRDHTLTLESYQAIGGAKGALARKAEEVYRTLDPAGQEATRQIFLRLVTLGEGIEDTRRRTLQAELLSLGNQSSAIQHVIAVFDRSRLLTFDHDPVTRGPTVEVAHEALLREWGTLRGWLDDSRGDVRQERLLAAAVAEWEQAKRDPDFLLAGSRLAQFEDWAMHSTLTLTLDERAYLDTSLSEHQRRQATEFARQAHELALQKQSANRLRYLVAGLAVFLVAALGLSIFAFGQRNEAQDARRISDANAAKARDLALVNGAQAALAKEDRDTALALATAANRTAHPSAQAQAVLSEVAYLPGEIRRFNGHHEMQVMSLKVTPDGRTVESASWDGTLLIWDVTTGQVIHTLIDHNEGGWVVALLSPDGQTVASITQDKKLALWDVATGSLIRSVDNSPFVSNCFQRLLFSPDGRTLLNVNGGGLPWPSCQGGDAEARMVLWDVATGQVIRTYQGYEYGVMGYAFSPDGRFILSVMLNGILTLTDTETGKIMHQFGQAQDITETGSGVDVVFSPDGKTALTSWTTGTMVLWGLDTYQEIRRFDIGPGLLRSHVSLSRDGRTALVSGNNGATWWDLQTGAQLAFLPGDLLVTTLMPDGRTALSGHSDGTLRLWDLSNGAQIARFPVKGLADFIPPIEVSPDGRTVLTCIDQQTPEGGDPVCQVALFDAATGMEIRRFGPENTYTREIVFISDGQRVVLSSNYGFDKVYLVSIWEVNTGQEISRFSHDSDVQTAAFSPDGKTVLMGDANGLLILLDATTGQEIRRLEGHTAFILDIDFSPDGKMALSAAQDNLIILWDVATGQEISRFDHEAPVNTVEFSPEGKTALSGGDNAQVILWEVSTGRRLNTFVGHTQLVTDLHFSPDGTMAFSTAQDATIQWDVATGQALRRYPGSAWRIAVSPDGRSLFVPGMSPDSAIYQYRIDTADELLAWTLEHRYIRNLTCTERVRYQVEPSCK